jgi:hypothetical protein
MLVVQSILYVVDGSVGYGCELKLKSSAGSRRGRTHAAAFQHFKPFLRRLLLRLVLDDIFQLVPILHSDSIRLETFVGDQLGLPYPVAENTVQTVIATTKKYITV